MTFCSTDPKLVGTPAEQAFLQIASPLRQSYYAASAEKAHDENAPMLSQVYKALGSRYTKNWVSLQLNAVLQAAGAKDCVTAEELDCVALDLVANYPWLKVTEFMAFCSRLRAGGYGQLAYGKATVADITAKIPSYLAERIRELDSLEVQRHNKELEREHAKRDLLCVTHEEAKAIIARAAAGDPEARALLQNNPDNWT